MRMEKIKLERDDTAIVFDDGRMLPMSVVRNGLLTILIIVALALGYNYGQVGASEYMKWMSFYSTHGIYNEDTDLYMRCNPVQSGVSIVWDCKEIETEAPYSIPLNISRDGA